MSIIERAADKLRDSQKSKDSRRSAPDPVDRDLSVEEARASTPELAGQRAIGDEMREERAEARENTVHIDQARLQAAGLLPPPASREQLGSEYRRIKRPLLANVTGRGAVRVDRGAQIMITSALAGEGKTFTAFNLAYSLAQEPDWEVVLIDGDNVRQTLSHCLGLEARPGLMDVLKGDEVDVEDIEVATDVPRLSFVPAGTRHALASEYFSSRQMEVVLDRLGRGGGRILIFDAPPLLGSPEALVLAEAVGQIIVVVKAGATERKAVAAAVQPLDKKKAINFLLNQVVRAHGDSYGGYHYGYAYDYEPGAASHEGRHRSRGG